MKMTPTQTVAYYRAKLAAASARLDFLIVAAEIDSEDGTVATDLQRQMHIVEALTDELRRLTELAA